MRKSYEHFSSRENAGRDLRKWPSSSLKFEEYLEHDILYIRMMQQISKMGSCKRFS